MKTSIFSFLFILTSLSLQAQGMAMPEEAERTSDAQLERQLKAHIVNLMLYDEIPDTVLDDKELTQLFIGNSFKIRLLPRRLGKLNRLKKLHLNGTGLIDFPKTILELDSLTDLEVTICYIREIPSEIEKLSRLKQLKFNSMPITSLPAEIGKLAQLEKLNLNDLKGNYRIGNRSLKLEGLKVLPTELGNMSALIDLQAYRTGLDSLPESIGNLKNLVALGLGGNNLTSIPNSICDLKSLERLHLSRNPLGELPENIGNLKNLQRIDLDYTALEYLPESIKQLKNLKGLFVIGTKIPDEELRSIKVALPDCTIYNSIGKKM